MKRKHFFSFLLAFFGVFSAVWAQQPPLLSESFEGTTFPPTGWTLVDHIPTVIWSGETSYSINSGTVTPKDGSRMAVAKCELNSARDKVTALVSPAFTPAANMQVSFWMYRSSNYTSYKDSLLVYVNSSPELNGAAVKTLALPRLITAAPIEPSKGWYQYFADIPAAFVGQPTHVLFAACAHYGDDIAIDDIKVVNPPACSPPVAFHVSAAGTSDLTLSWETGSASSWNIEYRSKNETTWHSQTATSSPYLLTLPSPSPDSLYQVHISTQCPDMTYSNYTPIIEGYLPCVSPISVQTAAWTEGFENAWQKSYFPGNVVAPDCWIVFDGGAKTATGSPARWQYRSNTTAHGGDSYAACYTDGLTGSSSDWLISPLLSLTGNERLSFWVRSQDNTINGMDEIAIYITSKVSPDTNITGDPATGFMEIRPSELINFSTWTFKTMDFPNSLVGDYRIAFVRRHTPIDGYWLSLDDITVERRPACPAPTASITEVTPNSVTVAINGTSGGTWDVNYRNIATQSWDTITTTATTILIDNLITGIRYEFIVKEHCPDGSFSDGCAAMDTILPCVSINTFPWSEGFEAAWTPSIGNAPAPACWINFNYGSGGAINTTRRWNRFEDNRAGYEALSGNGFARVYAYGSEAPNDWLVTPILNLDGNKVLTFFVRNASSMSNERNELSVYISAMATPDTIIGQDAATSFVNIYPSTPVDLGDWHRITIPLTGYSGEHRIAFVRANQPYSGYLSLDDVSVDNAPVCPYPQEVQIRCGATVAKLFCRQDQGIVSYTAHYRKRGTTAYQTQTSASLPIMLTGLQDSTTYEVYLTQSNAAGTSPASDITRFSTTILTTAPYTEPFANDSTSLARYWSYERGALTDNVTFVSPVPEDLNVGLLSASTTLNVFTGMHGVALFPATKVAQDWSISPVIDIPAGQPMQLEFEALLSNKLDALSAPDSNNTDDKFAIVISLDEGLTWSNANAYIWDSLATYKPFSDFTSQLRRYIIPLQDRISNNPLVGKIRFGIYSESTVLNAENVLHFDNVKVSPLETCPAPLISSITPSESSARVEISPVGNETQWQYEIVDTAAAFTGATTPTVQNVSFSISALSPATAYKVRVRSICGTDYSPWTAEMRFHTYKEPASVPFFCDFETNYAPEKWTMEHKRGKSRWIIDSLATDSVALYITSQDTVHPAPNIYTLDGGYSVSYAYIDVLFGTAPGYKVSFDWKGKGNSSDFCKVLLQDLKQSHSSSFIPAMSTENVVAQYNNKPALYNSTTWQHSTAEIDGLRLQGEVKRLVFYWASSSSGVNNPPIAIDNISIEEITCPQVSVSRISIDPSAGTSTTVTLANPETASSWLIRLKNMADNSIKDTIVDMQAFPVVLPTASSTTYGITIRGICAAGDSSDFSVLKEFTTPCMAIPVPTTETFSLLTSCFANRAKLFTGSSIPASSLSSSVATYSWVITNGKASINLYSASQKEWLLTPSYYLGTDTADFLIHADLWGSKNNNPTVQMDAGSDDVFGILVSRDNGNTWDSIDAAFWTNASNATRHLNSLTTTATRHTIALPHAAGTIRLALYAASTINNKDVDLFVDNLRVEPATVCQATNHIVVSEITDNSVLLTWDSVSNNGYVVYYKDTTATDYTVVPSATHSLRLNSLTAATTYDLHIKTLCGSDTSGSSPVVRFITNCLPVSSFPYNEGFENGLGCYRNDNVSDHETFWKKTTEQVAFAYSAPHSGNEAATIYGNINAAADLVSPIFNLTTLSRPYLSYYYRIGNNGGKDSLVVLYRPSPDSVWSILRQYPDGNTAYELDSIALPQPSATYQIAFRSIGGFGGGIAIDDLTIDNANTVASRVVTENPVVGGETTATLHGSIVAGNDIIENRGFEWKVVGNGSFTEVIVVGTSESPFNTVLTGLTAETGYLCKAFITVNGAKIYGADKLFATPATPASASVVTDSVGRIRETTAVLYGTANAGNETIDERGFEWSLASPEQYTKQPSAINTDHYSVPISGLTANTAYKYRAYIIVGGNTRYGEEKTFTTQSLSIETVVGDTQLQIYPNPATDKINITARGFSGTVRFTLTDLNGRTLWQHNGNSLNDELHVTLDVSRFTSGAYYLRLENGSHTSVRKLIIR